MKKGEKVTEGLFFN